MTMASITRTAAIIAALAFGCRFAAAAPIYDTSLVASLNVTAFGSGIVTGPADIGGLWLGSSFDPPELLGSLTVGFATPLADGAGIDLTVVDVGSSAEETFLVEVSSDNVSFTPLGEFSATNNEIDFNGLFARPVRYVRLTNTSDIVSADIDTLFGNYEFSTPAPEPGTLALALIALAAAALAIRAPTSAPFVSRRRAGSLHRSASGFR